MGLCEPADQLRDSSFSRSLPGEDTVRLARSPRAVGRAVAHSSPTRQLDAATTTSELPPDAAEETLIRRRQLRHDIRHELGTIMLLASLIDGAPDVGPESRRRAGQILGEARWLDHLQRAYEDTFTDCEKLGPAASELIRFDQFTSEAVAAVRLSTPTTISFTGREAWAYADRLALWRVLRNMIGNAVRAAGPDGRVDVRVERLAGWVLTQIDDDGPGFGAAPAGTESLGLEIVREFAAAWDGHLEIRRSNLGGCCVRLAMPAASPSLSAVKLGEL